MDVLVTIKYISMEWSLTCLKPFQRVLFFAHKESNIPLSLRELGPEYNVIHVTWDQFNAYMRKYNEIIPFVADIVMFHPIFDPMALTWLEALWFWKFDMSGVGPGHIVVCDHRVVKDNKFQLWQYECVPSIPPFTGEWSLARLKPHQRVLFLAYKQSDIPLCLRELSPEFNVLHVTWDALDAYLNATDTVPFIADIVMFHPMFDRKALRCLKDLWQWNFDLSAFTPEQIVVYYHRDRKCLPWTYGFIRD